MYNKLNLCTAFSQQFKRFSDDVSAAYMPSTLTRLFVQYLECPVAAVGLTQYD